MSETILLLGAGKPYIDLVSAAQRSGYEVVAIDRDENAPAFAVADYSEPVDITDVDGATAVARRYDVSGVIPINDYGVPTAAKVAERLGLIGISPSIARICTDKAAMRRAWDNAGVPQPDFAVARDVDVARGTSLEFGFPVVFKPANSVGGGSRGVSVVRSKDEIDEAFRFAQQPYDDDRVLVEECAVGTEHSIEVVCVSGSPTAIAVSDKEKTDLPYRVDKSVIYPSKSTHRRRIEEAAEQAVRALGIDIGCAHVELAVEDGQPKLFELGARVGGGATADPIIPAVTGIDYFAQLTRLHAGEDVDPLVPTKRDGVVYRFLTPDSGMLQCVEGIESACEQEGVLSCRIWVASGDRINSVQVGGDRSGAVITHRSTRTEAYRLADRVEDAITFVMK